MKKILIKILLKIQDYLLNRHLRQFSKVISKKFPVILILFFSLTLGVKSCFATVYSPNISEIQLESWNSDFTKIAGQMYAGLGIYAEYSGAWPLYNLAGNYSDSYLRLNVTFDGSGSPSLGFGIHSSGSSLDGLMIKVSRTGSGTYNYEIKSNGWNTFDSGSFNVGSDTFSIMVDLVGSSGTLYVNDLSIDTFTYSTNSSGIAQFYLPDVTKTNLILNSIDYNSGSYSALTPTPTIEPTPTSTNTYSEPIPTITPYQTNSPYEGYPYLHESCANGMGVEQFENTDTGPGVVANFPFQYWDYPVSIDDNLRSQGSYGAYISYGGATTSRFQSYRLKMDSNIPFDVVLDSYRIQYLVKGQNFQHRATGYGFPQNIYDYHDEYQSFSTWTIIDDLVETTVYPTEAQINNINDGLEFDIRAVMQTDTSFMRFSTPLLCLYYYDDNPNGAILEIPEVPGSGIVNNSVGGGTCTFNTNSLLNIPYYFCEIKNWFIDVIKYLFIPQGNVLNSLEVEKEEIETIVKERAPLSYFYYPFYYDYESAMTDDPNTQPFPISINIPNTEIQWDLTLDLKPTTQAKNFIDSILIPILEFFVYIEMFWIIFNIAKNTFSFTKEV